MHVRDEICECEPGVGDKKIFEFGQSFWSHHFVRRQTVRSLERLNGGGRFWTENAVRQLFATARGDRHIESQIYQCLLQNSDTFSDGASLQRRLIVGSSYQLAFATESDRLEGHRIPLYVLSSAWARIALIRAAFSGTRLIAIAATVRCL